MLKNSVFINIVSCSADTNYTYVCKEKYVISPPASLFRTMLLSQESFHLSAIYLFHQYTIDLLHIITIMHPSSFLQSLLEPLRKLPLSDFFPKINYLRIRCLQSIRFSYLFLLPYFSYKEFLVNK